MHPKSAIPPTRIAIKRVLDLGWWGQVKIHGHRAQIHLSADENALPIVYTRQGERHKKTLPQAIVLELKRLFAPVGGWTVIDAEWHKPSDKLYIFDILKHNGRLLDTYTFADRYELLPRVYTSPMVETLPLLKSVEQCLSVLESADERVEGLVFKSPLTEGFLDTGIVRCLKRTRI